MSITLITIIASVFALAAAVLAFVFIVPAKKRAKLNGFGKVIHDLLNFKDLWIEKAFKFLYVLSTAFSVICGFFMLFWVEETYHYSYSYYYGSSSYYTKEWMGYYGLLVMLLGPIAVRIAYEFIMLFILACKNIIDINNKLPEKCEKSEPKADDTVIASNVDNVSAVVTEANVTV